MKIIFSAIIVNFFIVGPVLAQIFNFPSEEDCISKLRDVKSVMENAIDIRYCQTEKNGSELYCKKTDGTVAFAQCRGKTFAASGF